MRLHYYGGVSPTMLGCLLFATTLVTAAPAAAHPAPFSYLDVRLADRAISGSLVLHNIDVAHELQLPSPDILTDPTVVERNAARIAALLALRLTFVADGRALEWLLVSALPLADRAAVELTWRIMDARQPGRLTIHAALFPYDSSHQTFVNMYEGDILTRQEVLNGSRPSADFYTRSRQGTFAVFRAFTASGIHHIAIGPDHVLFVIGLLLLGGSIPRLLAIVSAFTVGHSITLSLATLGIVTPPAHLVEPAIALSIVYVGADNLMVGAQSRDVRAWIALFFGLVHGFGFASVLRETGLPPRALGISLFSFNFGVEIGQAMIVIGVAWVLRAVHARQPMVGRRIATAGSVVVVLAGSYWFVQRVFG
jgi:hydrogenase/urease accessory protein HupE